jgi:hypothetical protein
MNISNGDETPNTSKRLKFVSNGDEGARSLSSVPLTNYHNSQDESMTTESILEQMNQTEKRFLPDDDSPPSIRPLPKKQRGNSSMTPRLTSTPVSNSNYRKRRVSPGTIISLEEEEEAKEKVPRFCTCSECYEEAAGIRRNLPIQVNKTPSPQIGQQRKRVTFSGDVRAKNVNSVQIQTTPLGTRDRDTETKSETPSPILPVPQMR